VRVLHCLDPGWECVPELAGVNVAQRDRADLARLARSGEFGELVVYVDLLVTLGDGLCGTCWKPAPPTARSGPACGLRTW
jgi:hypothetical protein